MKKPKLAPPRVSAELVEADGRRALSIKIEEGYERLFGTRVAAFMEDQVSGLISAISPSGGYPSPERIQAALALIQAVKPRNEIEAALAVQLAVTHMAALNLVGRVTRASDPQALDLAATAATKFQRTFALQLETLARMRRGGKQVVTVQHIAVNGGQAAIVGRVDGQRRRGVGKSETQAHEQGQLTTEAVAALTAPDGRALWGSEPCRAALPGAEGEGPAEMPVSRRGSGKRRTSR